MLKYNNGCISLPKQQCTSLLWTEAEYIALTETAQATLTIKKLIEDFWFQLEKSTTLFEDNQSCIKLLRCEKCSKGTKHVDTEYHFICDLLQKNVNKLSYCPAGDI